MCVCMYQVILNVKALVVAQSSTGTVGLFLLLGKEYMYHQ